MKSVRSFKNLERRAWFARSALVIALAAMGCKSEEKGDAGRPLTPMPPASNAPADAISNGPTGSSGNATANAASTDAVRSTSNTSSSAGVSQTGTTTSGSDVLATIDGIPITRQAVEKPLIEAYGLTMLAKVSQLELAKREATRNGVTVFEADVNEETERYLTSLFDEGKDPTLREINAELDAAQTANDAKRVETVRARLRAERFRLLDQLLIQQKLTHADFELAMRTNTYLRRIALAAVKKDAITEENLQQAFNQLYGEKVQVRVIALQNLQEATEAKRRVSSGEPFEKVAREMSRNQQSGMMGGELAPFSRESGYPQQFKDVAFALRPGEISDPVAVSNGYNLIKLEQRIPPNPKVIKLDDVRASVRDQLYEGLIEESVRRLSTQLKTISLQSMTISEPTLRKQFEEQVLKRDDEVKKRNEVQEEFERRTQALRRKDAASTQPTAPEPVIPPAAPSTAPATTPASALSRPTTMPSARP